MGSAADGSLGPPATAEMMQILLGRHEHGYSEFRRRCDGSILVAWAMYIDTSSVTGCNRGSDKGLTAPMSTCPKGEDRRIVISIR